VISILVTLLLLPEQAASGVRNVANPETETTAPNHIIEPDQYGRRLRRDFGVGIGM